MSNEQIKEMARVIKSSLDGLGSGNFNFTGYEISTMFAKALYKAGYGKQSEGEWKLGKSGCMYFCSSCNYAAHPREEEEWDFCPNCGAHMRKEDEGK